MALALCLIFFLSGASALLFETLWFRLAGLVFGNSVWASSLVLAGFMGGLALGNGIAAWRGERLRSPIRLYALLEATIGATGLGLVLLLPALTRTFAPLFRPLLETPWALNPLRLCLAFALLLVPTTAMGVTLPLLVKALTRQGAGFGSALGQLYAWNTLGAVVGSLAGEGFLIERLGLTGTGVVAALLNLLAALAATALGRLVTLPTPEALPAPAPGGGRRVLAAAALSGGILLALEVVWFRFLLLFALGTSLAFAVMLSVVLLGIAAGGFLASRWLRSQPDAHHNLPLVALAAGGACVLVYAGFDAGPGNGPGRFVMDGWGVFSAALRLMLPVSVLSGLLFTLLGRALRDSVAGELETVGRLTLANTLGAMAGALLAGFVLLPQLGMERSFFVLALAYGGVALATLERSPRLRPVLLVVAAAFVAAAALFPFGLMQNHYLRRTAARFAEDGSRLVAVREGLTETLLYLRNERWGERYFDSMLTNGFCMSGTQPFARRYMKLFVYWPMAVRPEARRALLISYGVGSTAKALTDTRSLESIDIVDISRDVLEMSNVAIPPSQTRPLDDPRVRVHVEDGRFFLLTTDKRFDLITAEPPPPKNAGIVNLYSREYFQLIHDRLDEGGVASYWLPVFLLEAKDTRAAIKAFCSAFEDCSLWTGAFLDWMLVGTRHAPGPISEEAFTRQWNDPIAGPELRTLGLETPEALGTTFLADAPFLKELTRDDAPVTDDDPYRISGRIPTPPFDSMYASLMELGGAQRRFAGSDFVRRHWPAALRARSIDAFPDQQAIVDTIGSDRLRRFATLRMLLERSASRTLPLWVMRSAPELQVLATTAAARGANDPDLIYTLGLGAIAERDYRLAAERLAAAETRDPKLPDVRYYRILASTLAGDRVTAKALLLEARGRARQSDEDPKLWDWAEKDLGLQENPA